MTAADERTRELLALAQKLADRWSNAEMAPVVGHVGITKDEIDRLCSLARALPLDAPTTTDEAARNPIHPFVERIDDAGLRSISMRVGGSAERCGLRWQMLFLATRAMHECLRHLGAAPRLGPARVVVKLLDRDFISMRDALVADSDSGAALFRKPRRKRIDPNLRRFMLSGILFVADNEPEQHNFACPMSSAKPRKKAADAL
ncbi:MAG: hypothetical protein J0L59_01375 [Xanthomonadales bacterium]|nr:hypothetical protein [Xanthomonadales bacterium]